MFVQEALRHNVWTRGALSSPSVATLAVTSSPLHTPREQEEGALGEAATRA